MATTHAATTRTAIADAVVDRLDVGGTGTLEFRTSGDVEVATLTFSATAYGAAAGPTATANTITADSSATGGTIAKAAQRGVTYGDVILCSVTATGGGGGITGTGEFFAQAATVGGAGRVPTRHCRSRGRVRARNRPGVGRVPARPGPSARRV